MTRRPAWNKHKQKSAFIEALKKRVFVSPAAEDAGIDRTTVYLWREEDAEFKRAWDDVDRMNTDKLKSEAFRRAAVGVDEPVYGRVKEWDKVAKRYVEKTGVVGTVKRYSDKLMELMLKARDPEFREAVRHDINLQFVEVLVVRFNNLVQRFVPLKCPHCQTLLPIRKDLAAGLESMPDTIDMNGPKTGGP